MTKIVLNHLYIAGGVLAVGLILYHILFYFIKSWAHQKKRILPNLLSKYIYYPGLSFITIILCWIGLVILEPVMNVNLYVNIRHVVIIIVTSCAGFIIIRAITVISDLTMQHYSVGEPNNYNLRKVKTKFQLIQRVLNVLIISATIAVILMTFSTIRQFGTTLLASAGIVGLIIGVAAQKTLGTIFAGLQIAISQPIRIDDTVLVEGQYGKIVKITLTYVMINVWEGRRLIIPISYFLEKPFENWTRTSPAVVGKVIIYAHYNLPVDKIREVLGQWLEESVLWDKRKWALVVLSAKEKTIELRASMSAKNAEDAFNLEFLIREKLIDYISKNFPACLPGIKLYQ